MKYPVSLFILVLSISAVGQRSITDLEPLHRKALENYLKPRTSMSLRSETILDREYLADMVAFIGGRRPNYAVGDFNRDKRMDFAVLLTRRGKPRNAAPGANQSSEHFPDFPLHLVVFNGGPRSTFRPAFSINFYGPPAGFLYFDRKARRLFYSVFETDSDTFSLTPRGSGYRAKSEAF